MSHVVGTAGHIDHGKSTLIRALTGIDPDRLEEEKRRGMTIDLGFAHLTLPDGRLVAYLGHERGWTYGAPTELLTVPLEGGDSRSVSGGFEDEVSNAALSDARDPGSDTSPVWAPDGRSLLATVSRSGRVEVVRFGLDGQKPTVMVGGDRLKESTAASTVRIANGKNQVLDGPYAETKEQLGGYYLLDVADLDAALSWAARCPGASHGAVEVRPLWGM